MLKKIIGLFVSMVMFFSLSVPAMAIDLDSEGTAQQELNETMSKVVAYLNEHQELSLNHHEVQEFEVPIGNDEFVSVTIENKQIPNTRNGGASGADREYYDVVLGKSYTYTLTIKNFYLSSGKIVYTVDYTVGEKVGNNAFHLAINDVDINATAPFGFTVSSTDAIDRTNGNSQLIVKAGGYALFKGPLGGDLGMIVEITLAGVVRGGANQVGVDYLYYDMDDV